MSLAAVSLPGADPTEPSLLMKNRLPRVNELLKRELGALLTRDFEFKNCLVTVNAVDVTPDLRQAHVYLGIIGDAHAKEGVLAKLGGKRAFIQQRLSKRVVLKYTPHLYFKLDESVEHGVALVDLMQEVEHEDELRGPIDDREEESAD